MQKWYQIFQRSTGLSPYVWVVFYILPFYFIFRTSSSYRMGLGIGLILLFFICYVLSFKAKGWLVYFWTGLQIAISITMTLLFGYVYFALFLAFFIGNIQNRIGFFTLYSIHLVTTVVTINFGFVSKNPMFLTQLPFVLVSLIAVILLPVTTYNRNRSDKLQGQLENANKRISELVKLEERQRIARDLHDTLGQKLSLIGLKSDLAGKLIARNPERAEREIQDVRQTARTALKEVRELVTQMRGLRLDEEVHRIRQVLKAAQIDFELEGEPTLRDTPPVSENVLSMCLKEAVTNVVRHSGATACTVRIKPAAAGLVMSVSDNGTGLPEGTALLPGHGLRGMKERLEFVNGSLRILRNGGTTLVMEVPNALNPAGREAES